MAPRQLAKHADGTLCQHGSTQDRADGTSCVSTVRLRIMLMSESIDHVEHIISINRLVVPC